MSVLGTTQTFAQRRLNFCLRADCWHSCTAREIDRQLWEIDENLMRAELTSTEMSEHLA